MSDAVVARIDELLRRRSDPECLRIGIAGGSGSGKSSVAESMRQGLRPCTVEIVGLDRFFKPVDEMPKYYSHHHGEHFPDFNTPESLRVDEMIAFSRTASGVDVLILDGHFALYFAEMRELMDMRCFVATDMAEMLDRRTRRNLAIGYGGDRETILAYNRECVQPRHEEHILPTEKFADVVIPNGNSDRRDRERIVSMLCRRILAQHATRPDRDGSTART